MNRPSGVKVASVGFAYLVLSVTLIPLPPSRCTSHSSAE